MKRGNMPGEPYPGKWDYDGACDPLDGGDYAGMVTFTLGCWQWVRRGRNADGKGLKPGKVSYRIKGYVSDPNKAHAEARAYCERKQAQEPTNVD